MSHEKSKDERKKEMNKNSNSKLKDYEKPCEYSFIKIEEEAIVQIKKNRPKMDDESVKIVKYIYNGNLKKYYKHLLFKYKQYDVIMKNLLLQKPNTSVRLENNISKKSLLRDINKIFKIDSDKEIKNCKSNRYYKKYIKLNPIQRLILYCQLNIRIHNKPMSTIYKISLSDYIKLMQQKQGLIQKIRSVVYKINELNKKLNVLYDKKRDLKEYPIPDNDINITKKIDINNSLINYLIDNGVVTQEKTLDKCCQDLDVLYSLDNTLIKYQNDVINITENGSKQSVYDNLHINDLKKSIIDIKNEIEDKFKDMLGNLCNCNEIKNKIMDYKYDYEWYKYYVWKEKCQYYDNEMQTIKAQNEKHNIDKIYYENILNDICDKLSDFNNNAHNLYDLYNYSNMCNIYRSWEKTYYIVFINKRSLKKKMNEVLKQIHYDIYIRKRSNDLVNLKEQYKKWYENNDK